MITLTLDEMLSLISTRDRSSERRFSEFMHTLDEEKSFDPVEVMIGSEPHIEPLPIELGGVE